MMDEIFDRNYQSGRAQLNDSIDHAAKKVADTLGASLRALHRIEWSAPWNPSNKARAS